MGITLHKLPAGETSGPIDAAEAVVGVFERVAAIELEDVRQACLQEVVRCLEPVIEQIVTGPDDAVLRPMLHVPGGEEVL